MIIIEEGSKETLPYVRVEIEPGQWPFEYWFEVCIWDADHEIEGRKLPCFTHAYKFDGGGFGLWRVWKKAREACDRVWDYEYEESMKLTASHNL